MFTSHKTVVNNLKFILIDLDERKWSVAISEIVYGQHSQQTMARKTDTNLKPKTVNSPSQERLSETVGPEEVASRAGVYPSYMVIQVHLLVVLFLDVH